MLGPFNTLLPENQESFFAWTDREVLNFVILIVLTEHLIMLTSFLMQDIISDVPGFVADKAQSINHTLKEMNVVL